MPNGDFPQLDSAHFMDCEGIKGYMKCLLFGVTALFRILESARGRPVPIMHFVLYPLKTVVSAFSFYVLVVLNPF